MPTAETYRYLPAALADRLRSYSLSVRRPAAGRWQGQHRSSRYGASVEFAEYRQYAHGDPVSLIDWDVYARSDRYVIRRYQEETNLEALVLLDTSASLDFRGGGPVPKLEYACRLAAALLYVLVHQGDTAGLACFDRTLHTVHEPAATLGGLRRLLLGLEAVRGGGESDIEACLHAAAERLTRRTLVILLSDLLLEPDALRRGLQHLHHDGHDVTVFHLLDPEETAFGGTGLTELQALESNERLVVDPDELREAYAAEVERYLDEVRAACDEVAADYALTPTATPLEPALGARLQRI
jgi:uncharacterized protein (DUF58 family)